MNLLEIATGAKSTEYKVVLVILGILGCQVLGVDATVVLPFILDGSDVIKYQELIEALNVNKGNPSSAGTWALALIGVGYPLARAYVKKLKSELIQRESL